MKKIAKVFQALCYWPFLGIFKLFFRFRTFGQENLNGLENGPIIFASNHGSFLDGPFAAAAMPRRRGQLFPADFFPIRFLARRQYFKWYYFLIALYVWLNGSIRVEPHSGQDLGLVLKEAVEQLKNNAHVWIFPEGRISKDGQIRPGKKGVAFLHQQTGAPIVPVAISGNNNIFSFKGLFGLQKVRIKIGKPIYSFSGHSLEEITGEVMSEISNLFNSF